VDGEADVVFLDDLVDQFHRGGRWIADHGGNAGVFDVFEGAADLGFVASETDDAAADDIQAGVGEQLDTVFELLGRAFEEGMSLSETYCPTLMVLCRLHVHLAERIEATPIFRLCSDAGRFFAGGEYLGRGISCPQRGGGGGLKQATAGERIVSWHDGDCNAMLRVNSKDSCLEVAMKNEGKLPGKVCSMCGAEIPAARLAANRDNKYRQESAEGGYQ
jgi:hypothetical protein